MNAAPVNPSTPETACNMPVSLAWDAPLLIASLSPDKARMMRYMANLRAGKAPGGTGDACAGIPGRPAAGLQVVS